jgi:hypothetical protein
MPQFSDCRDECETFKSCEADVYRTLLGEVPDYLSEEHRNDNCIAGCIICPDEAAIVEAQARIDALDACLAAESELPVCKAAYWCRYLVDSASLGCSPVCAQATADCVGTGITPDLIWDIGRAVAIPNSWPCETTDCSEWLECSGYNAVKAYDAAHGGGG